MMCMSTPDLSDLSAPGTIIPVRATPKASRTRIEREGNALRIYVTAAPDKGKANEAIRKILAKALGVAKSDLTLLRGDTARDKLFRVE